MKFILKVVIMAAAILIVAYLVPGLIEVRGISAALVAALVLGIINAILRPIMLILTLPINILTLGLFTFVINALMLMLTAFLVSGFAVSGLLGAVVSSILLSVISTVLSILLPGTKG